MVKKYSGILMLVFAMGLSGCGREDAEDTATAESPPELDEAEAKEEAE